MIFLLRVYYVRSLNSFLLHKCKPTTKNHSRFPLLHVVHARPMARPQRPHNLRLTAEALPVVVRRDVGDDAARQIRRNAFAAEHENALGTAVDLAALAAPAAVQLAAILAALELAAGVERIATAALGRSHHRMRADLVLDGRRAAQMLLARGAVQP